MKVRTYVKKPFDVKAMHFDGFEESKLALMGWVVESGEQALYYPEGALIVIITDAGSEYVRPGDYVVSERPHHFEALPAIVFASMYDLK